MQANHDITASKVCFNVSKYMCLGGINVIYVQCIKSCRYSSKASVNAHFNCYEVVDARKAVLEISETADPLGFTHTSVSCIYKECCEKHRRKSLVWFELMIYILITVRRKASQHTQHHTLRWMCYSITSPHLFPLMSKNNLRPSWAEVHLN